ncbi:MAG: hypothetical protein AB7Q27_29265, partial [Acidimicrobiia bacterium]
MVFGRGGGRVVGVGVVVLGLVVSLGACGDDDADDAGVSASESSSVESSDVSSSVESSDVSSSVEVSGEPVRVGFLNDSAVASANAQYDAGMDAAVQALNAAGG